MTVPTDGALGGSTEDLMLDEAFFAGTARDDATLERRFNQLDADRLEEFSRLNAEREEDLGVMRREEGELERERERLLAQVRASSEEQQALSDQASELETALDDQTRREVALLGELRHRRLSYEERLRIDALTRRTILSRQAADQIVEEERHALTVEQELLGIARQRYELNKPEYERRAGLLGRAREQYEEALAEVQRVIQLFRGLGLTQKGAGFLTWAGYLGFVAFGWMIGTGIKASRDGDSRAAESTLGAVVAALRSLQDQFGPTTIPLLLFGIPVLALMLVAGLTFLTDVAIGRLDPNWKGSKRRRTETATTAGVGGLWPFVSVPTKLVTREDFAQLLAKVPGAAVTLLAPAGIAIALALAPSTTQTSGDGTIQAADPWSEILYTYVGITIAIVSAAFAYLYVSRVVEPRLSNPKLGDSEGSRFFSANMEMFGIVLVAAIAVVASELSPILSGTWSLWSTKSLVGPLGLAVINAAVVAYGIYLKGLIHDAETLQQKIDAVLTQEQAWLGLPSIELDDPAVARWRDTLRDLQAELRAISERRSRTQGAELWFDPDGNLRNVGFFEARWRSLFMAPGSLGARGLTSDDSMLEAELVGRLFELEREHQALLRRLHQTEAERTALEKRLSDARTEIGDVEGRLTVLRDKLRAARREWSDRIQQRNRYYTTLRSELEQAFRLGLQLHSRTT